MMIVMMDRHLQKVSQKIQATGIKLLLTVILIRMW